MSRLSFRTLPPAACLGRLSLPLIVLAVLGIPVPGWTAAPPAGSVIGNQASATYTDASLISRTTTSNTVITTVQQVASLTLSANQTRTVAPGGTAYYSHTLVNSGNGTDTFSLTAVDADTGGITFTNLAVYADADGNGVPDSTTPINSTGVLAAGTTFRFVIGATVPGTATNGQTETITVSATSAFTGGVTRANTDTVNVTGNAVIALTKSLSVSSGPSPGTGQITVTLTYTNTGNTTATNLTVTDVIGTGATAGMAYVAGSGGWSGGTPVTDGAGGDAPGLAFDWNIAAANRVTAVISSVPPATTGTINFKVTIASGLSPGTAQTANSASYTYNDGTGAVGPFPTNTSSYTVIQSGGVVINGSNASAVNGTGEPVTVAAASQGATVMFTDYVWNTGNGSDTVDITISGSTFPAGTTFQLYRADGLTPLSDSSGNGVPDTGPVSANASYAVVLKATLPVGATGGPFVVTLTATSIFDGSKSDTVLNTLSGITSSTADLTYAVARADSVPAGSANSGNVATTGWGAGPEVLPVINLTVQPGSTVTFPLYQNNTSGVADSYDILADKDGAFGTTNDLPSGWTIVFKLDGGSGNCSTTGATVTNSGVINAGANRLLCAIVTVPANQVAVSQNVYFRGRSATSSATDTLLTRVTVSAVRSLLITPSNSGQIYPGGSVVFAQSLTNTGNVTEGDGSVSSTTLSVTNSLAGWSAVVYYDLNNDGVLDAGDPVVPAGGIHLTPGAALLADGLAANESARFFVKVIAPAGAAIGDINTSTITATTVNGSYSTAVPVPASAQDTIQVIAGQVRLDKAQALDVSCDGTADGPYVSAPLTVGAVPGSCIRYQIIATNDGTASVNGLVINDSTPPFTTYDDGSRNSAAGVCGTGPVDAAASVTRGSVTSSPLCGATGLIEATIGTLTPGQSATLTFGVMINN